MVIMRDKSCDMISKINGAEGAACDLHGRHWTGVPVAAHDDSGEYAVLQYVHPDYIKVTERQIADFAAEKLCSVCGDPTEEMPLWVVERILKAHPYLVLQHNLEWEGICQDCAKKNACPHCDEKHDEGVDDDEDDNGDGGSDGWMTHPYCH